MPRPRAKTPGPSLQANRASQSNSRLSTQDGVTTPGTNLFPLDLQEITASTDKTNDFKHTSASTQQTYPAGSSGRRHPSTSPSVMAPQLSSSLATATSNEQLTSLITSTVKSLFKELMAGALEGRSSTEQPAAPKERATESKADRPSTRAASLSSAMDRSNDDMAGLEQSDLDFIKSFVTTPGPQVTPQHGGANSSSSNSTGSNSSSLGDIFKEVAPNDNFQRTDFDTVLADAIKSERNQRSFKGVREFYRSWNPCMLAVLKDFPEKYAAYRAYEQFLLQLAIERSWKAADFYHWEFFRDIKEGHTTMEEGPRNAYVLMEMERKFPAAKESNKKGAQAKQGDKQQKYCKVHGKCAHSTKECNSQPTSKEEKG
jgi:hypothetical protein